MGEREKPKTQREMLYQVWYTIFGSNGDSLITTARDTRDRVQKIEQLIPGLLSRKEHDEAAAARDKADQERREAESEAGDLRKMSRRDWLLVLFNGVIAFGAIGTFIFMASAKK